MIQGYSFLGFPYLLSVSASQFLPNLVNYNFPYTSTSLNGAPLLGLGLSTFPRYFSGGHHASLRRVTAVKFGTGCREDALVRGPTIPDPYVNLTYPNIVEKTELKYRNGVSTFSHEGHRDEIV